MIWYLRSKSIFWFKWLIKKGKAYFNKTKSLDHVQALVVKEGKILAKEGREGTKKMLSELKKNSDGILIKLPKKKLKYSILS